jgi:uncharacterized protein (TIGR03118 family)
MSVSSAALAQYQLTNLVSNRVGTARHTDPLMVNAWGLTYGPGGPFWLSDQGSGWSTLYTGQGVKKGLEVVVPSASGAGTGSPTGIVFNGSTSEFQVQGWKAFFLFATLDGTISGWAPQSNPNDAIIAVDNSASGAVYIRPGDYQQAVGEFSIHGRRRCDCFLDTHFRSASWFHEIVPAITHGQLKIVR